MRRAPFLSPALPVVVALLVVATTTARAQAPAVTLRGLAFDSVAMRPLAGAFIALDGVRNTRTDSLGGFVFDTVRLGIHELQMDHAVLDSMGLAGISRSVAVLDSTTLIGIAVPSFLSLWRLACGERPMPTDSGFVFGSVRDARDGEPVEGAVVTLSWFDFTLINIKEYRQTRYRAEIESDANGEFAICGSPLDANLQIAAAKGGNASGETTVGPWLRVRRRDLLIGPSDTTTTARGSVSGTITHLDGRPFEGATVVVDGGAPQRTEADGRFRFDSLLTGTRQVEVLALGARPRSVPVDVREGETSTLTIAMDRLTTLDVVRVIGTRWQVRSLEGIHERMAKGVGQFRDSTDIWNRQLLGSVFQGFRGLEMSYSRYGDIGSLLLPGRGQARRCSATVYIDGYREAGLDWLNVLKPQDIVLLEVYDRPELAPFEFPPTDPFNPCGVVAVWTKAVMP